MIKNFYRVNKNLYRGSAPDAEDVFNLIKFFKIKKIISLDVKCGNLIDQVCIKSNIDHIIIDIDPSDINSLKNLLKFNINKLVDPSIKTFVHCKRGKDRAGLFVALVRCIQDKWTFKTALQEAKQLGFGTGLDLPIERFYIKLIRSAASSAGQDINEANDILDYMNDSNSIYRDERFDPYNISWAPYADRTYRAYPEMREQQNALNNPYSGRNSNDIASSMGPIVSDVPVTGLFDDITQITNTTGPSVISGGFV